MPDVIKKPLLKQYTDDREKDEHVIDDGEPRPRRLASELVENYVGDAKPEAEGALDDTRLQSYLIAHLDYQDNIITTVTSDEKGQVTYIRDATKSLAFSDRIDQNHPQHCMENMLLRALTTMRAVKHARPETKQHLNSEFRKLLVKAIASQDSPMRTSADRREVRKTIEKLEAKFNAHLIYQLKKHKSLGQLKKPKELEKLLAYYRTLASYLDPAPIQETVTLLPNKKKCIERATPISGLTDQQQTQLEDFDPTSESNFYSNSGPAYQCATLAFKEKMKAAGHRPGAQARKNQPIGARNAYKVEAWVGSERKENRLPTVLRSATPVYIGEGETAESIKRYAQQNIQQMLDAVKGELEENKKLRVLMNILNTDFSRNKENLMVQTPQNAIEAKHDARVALKNRFRINNIPVNILGRTFWRRFPVALDKRLSKNRMREIDTLVAKLGLDITGPYRYAVSALLAFTGNEEIDKNVVLWMLCASGQDRTGTSMQVLMTLYVMKKCNIPFSYDNYISYSNALIKGLHNSTLAPLAVPGSRRLKMDSRAPGLFSDEAGKAMYGDTGYMNTKRPIDLELAYQLCRQDNLLGDGQIQKAYTYYLQEQLTKPRYHEFMHLISAHQNGYGQMGLLASFAVSGAFVSMLVAHAACLKTFAGVIAIFAISANPVGAIIAAGAIAGVVAFALSAYMNSILPVGYVGVPLFLMAGIVGVSLAFNPISAGIGIAVTVVLIAGLAFSTLFEKADNYFYAKTGHVALARARFSSRTQLFMMETFVLGGAVAAGLATAALLLSISTPVGWVAAGVTGAVIAGAVLAFALTALYTWIKSKCISDLPQLRGGRHFGTYGRHIGNRDSGSDSPPSSGSAPPSDIDEYSETSSRSTSSSLLSLTS